MTCDQAIIINRGRVALSGPIEDLRSRDQTLEEMFIRLVERDEASTVA
jgi:ABC-type Na+ transport system ATPase subunit NatA